MKGRSLSASRASERFLKLVRQYSSVEDDTKSRRSTGSNKSVRRNMSEKTCQGSTDSEVVMENNNNNNLRIIFLGAASVGKSSIINQFLGGTLAIKYKPTLQQMFVGKLELGSSTLLLSIEDTGVTYIQDFPAMAKLSLGKPSN